MIQLTVDRLLPIMDIRDIYIVTAANQCDLVREHLPQLPSDNIIIEPFGMNTAPCIALSIAYLKRRYPAETSLIVLPADHVITDHQAFYRGLELAEIPAASGHLVTFGIIPDYPATGYGYIEAGEPFEEGIYNVTQFKEKPDFATAVAFMKSGNFYWNSGMFYWKLQTIWNAFCDHIPAVIDILMQIDAQWQKHGTGVSIDELYAGMPKTPIDIGIMEKAPQRAVIPVNIGWSDVGSWKALSELSTVDGEGNSFSKSGLCIATKDCYVNTTKFTALIGVQNLCVIETEDAILITEKDKAEDVKKVVEHLTQNGIDELL